MHAIRQQPSARGSSELCERGVRVRKSGRAESLFTLYTVPPVPARPLTLFQSAFRSLPRSAIYVRLECPPSSKRENSEGVLLLAAVRDARAIHNNLNVGYDYERTRARR